MVVLGNVAPLPDRLTMRGGDPKLLEKELIAIISDYIANQPRSLQTRIGPSELGHPCARRIGYKLMGAPDLNRHQPVNWKAFVGTAMHLMLGDHVFAADNRRFASAVAPGDERWLIEHKVSPGWVGPDEIDGNSDLYDRITCTVIDWKLVGPTPLKNYRRHGPGQQYRTQAHTYGRGFSRQGLPVDRVMIVFLPRNGELRDTVFWSEPYDEQVAIDGLDRATAIGAIVNTLKVRGLEQLPTADAYCHHCSFYRSGSTDLRQGCPGDPASQTEPKPALTFEGPDE